MEEVKGQRAVDACLPKYVGLHRDVDAGKRLAGGEHATPQREAPKNLPNGLEVKDALPPPPCREAEKGACTSSAPSQGGFGLLSEGRDGGAPNQGGVESAELVGIKQSRCGSLAVAEVSEPPGEQVHGSSEGVRRITWSLPGAVPLWGSSAWAARLRMLPREAAPVSARGVSGSRGLGVHHVGPSLGSACQRGGIRWCGVRGETSSGSCRPWWGRTGLMGVRSRRKGPFMASAQSTLGLVPAALSIVR
jgi:hypothetical protein